MGFARDEALVPTVADGKQHWPCWHLGCISSELKEFLGRYPGMLWVNTNGIPFWGRCTTDFSTYFCGDWDVRWGTGF